MSEPKNRCIDEGHWIGGRVGDDSPGSGHDGGSLGRACRFPSGWVHATGWYWDRLNGCLVQSLPNPPPDRFTVPLCYFVDPS